MGLDQCMPILNSCHIALDSIYKQFQIGTVNNSGCASEVHESNSEPFPICRIHCTSCVSSGSGCGGSCSCQAGIMTGEPSSIGAGKGFHMPSGGVDTRTSSIKWGDDYFLGRILYDLLSSGRAIGEKA